jgi:hypothetical protein
VFLKEIVHWRGEMKDYLTFPNDLTNNDGIDYAADMMMGTGRSEDRW